MMRHFIVAIALADTLSGLSFALLSAAPAASCLHGPKESPAESSRRRAALDLARKINTTEAQANAQGHTYYAVSDLPGLESEVNGFKVQLSTDGGTYTFSIKDTRDPCGFAYFSDQNGLIYSAAPIQ